MSKAIPYPFSREVEQELLSLMLNHPKLIPYIARKVNFKMFYITNHQNLFRAITYGFNTVGDRIDAIKLTEIYMEKFGKENANTIVSEIINGGYDSGNVDWYAGKVAEYNARRRLVKSSQVMQQFANDMTHDINELSQLLTNEMEIITAVTTQEDNLEDDINAMAENIGNQNKSVPFGLQIMDKKFAGYMRNDITSIGGRTGHGKTTYTIDTARRQLDLGYSVSLVTQEVTKTLYLQKLACNIAQIVYEKVIKFGDISEEEMEKFLKAKEYMIKKYVGKLKLYQFIDNIHEITSIILNDKPDIFYLDWLTRIPLVPGVHDAREWIRHSYGQLAKTVPKTNTAAVIINQLSTRKAQSRGNKRPELFDFDESSFVEKASCDCHLVYWYYNDTLDRDWMQCFEVIAAKNRFGPPSVAILSHDPRIGKYYDSSTMPREKRNAYMKETGLGLQ